MAPDSFSLRFDGTILNGGIPSEYAEIKEKDIKVLMVAIDTLHGQIWLGRDGKWLRNKKPGESPAHLKYDKALPFLAVSSLHGINGTLVQHIVTEQQKFKYKPPLQFSSITGN